MLITEHKLSGADTTISEFSVINGTLDQLEVLNLPLIAGSVQILIYNEDKELMFEGFDITKDYINGSGLLLDDIGLSVTEGIYYLVIKQPSDPMLINKVNEVDSPNSLVLLLLGFFLIWFFRSKK